MKITFVTTNLITSGSARQRVYKLANYLKENKKDITISINENIKQADILVLQKSDPRSLNKALIKYYGKKFIVFDIDDFHPNGEYDFLIKYCDLVVVGSEYLKTKFSNLNKNIFVLDDLVDVKNLDCKLKGDSYLPNPKIGWFGNTCNLDALNETKVENVTKITRGGDIEWSLDTIDENLKKFDLVLIPQKKSITGLAKGNCRMLKCVYLGIPVLVSDLDSYVKLAELINYPKEFIVKDNENWNQRIGDIKSGKIQFNFNFEKARKTILQYYSVEAFSEFWLQNVLKYYNNKEINDQKTVKFYLIKILHYIFRLL